MFRWWTSLQQAPVELPAQPLAGFRPEVDLTIESDSGQRLRLRCGPADRVPLACRRDEAPPLVVAREEPLALAFTRETFAERRLLSFGTGEVRELEILPGRGSDAVRQSVRLDLGVWRLDAPVHPDGAAALDEVRLEAMLAGLQAARAEAWTDRPLTAPLRTIRVERTGSEAATLELHPDCVAHVPGQPRAALLPKSTCVALSDDLLYSDPLRFWLGQARRVELSSGTGSATATREGSRRRRGRRPATRRCWRGCRVGSRSGRCAWSRRAARGADDGEDPPARGGDRDRRRRPDDRGGARVGTPAWS
ncbi:hypothetical protein [Nannocystis pusilla]|uniref:hypothetical protein n=1 Tax=Nannocystis pusilla TaxID=889268 RepID=UPI003B7715AF